MGPGTRRPGDSLDVRGRLSGAETGAVLRVVAAAAGADGVHPLSEQVMLHVRGGGSTGAANLLLWADGSLAGYAHLDHPGPGERGGELVVAPGFRGRGRGRALVTALARAAAGRPFRVWAHGDLPAARRLAASSGFERVRSLWQLRRPLAGPLPGPVLPDGVHVRTFVPGRDEQAWLELNRLAFAGHPEQGAWTREDLAGREREPWFDPAGFFLAERRGKLAGFHWTKVHPAGGTAGPAKAADPAKAAEHSAAIGEVYVVGVHPDERGTGLGRALTVTGLQHLRARGLPEVMLYVDESNAAAVRLYESLAFARVSTDVMYRWPGGRG